MGGASNRQTTIVSIIDSMTESGTNTEIVLTAICTKCKKNPRADSSLTNKWCLECRAEHQRNYRATLLKQTAEQSFARGVTAMRQAVMNGFGKIGMSTCSGYDALGWIATMPAPKFDAEPEATEPK